MPILQCALSSNAKGRKEQDHEAACARLETTAMTFPLACMMGLYVKS
jgi:hypothetical protein